MKLKIKQHVTSSQEKIILMCSYKDESGVAKKYIEAVVPGSTIEVSTKIGMALLGTETLEGVLELDDSAPAQKNIDHSPQNRMMETSKDKKSMPSL